LIFLDGDCVPTPSFVARHRTLAEYGWFVAGNRALLSEGTTVRLLASGVTWRSASSVIKKVVIY